MAESPPFYDLGAFAGVTAVHFAEGDFFEVAVLSGQIGTGSAGGIFKFNTKPPHFHDPFLPFLLSPPATPPGFKKQPDGNIAYQVTAADLKSSLKFDNGSKILGVGAYYPNFADFAARSGAAFLQMLPSKFTFTFSGLQSGNDPISVSVTTYKKNSVVAGAQLDGAPGGGTKPPPLHGCVIVGPTSGGSVSAEFAVDPNTLRVTCPTPGQFTVISTF